METDICLTCNTIKPISELCKDRSLKTGYKKLCKPCLSKKCKKYWAKKVRVNTDNMYATGIAPEIREAIMEKELPVWERRFEIINEYRLSITKKRDVIKIDKVLALHGLS
jgi:hypothetical protein